MSESILDGKAVIQSITIKIRMPRAFGLRVWMVCQLFKLAGFVSPVKIEVEVE